MTTNAPLAKKAIIDRLKAQTAVGFPLEGVGVEYAYKPDLGSESIYGGGFRFTHDNDVSEAPGIMVLEVVEVSLYIRVTARPKTSIEQTDERARVIGNTIGAMLRAEPKLAGAGTYIGIRGGQGDYEPGDDHCTSILAYNLFVGTHMGY
jgi:hypothetical protein